MNYIIEKLEKLKDNMHDELRTVSFSPYEHNTPEQTRVIVLMMAKTDVFSDIEKLIEKLKILNRELF